MADTSDLVKRLKDYLSFGTFSTSVELRQLLTAAADALESAPTMRIEVDTEKLGEMRRAALQSYAKQRGKTLTEIAQSQELLPFSLALAEFEVALTAALNPQQEKNNG